MKKAVAKSVVPSMLMNPAVLKKDLIKNMQVVILWMWWKIFLWKMSPIPRICLNLYPGVVLSICAAICAIMTYAINNKLSYSAIETLLKLLHLLCPASNHLPSSLNKLKIFFQNFTSNYEKRCMCEECKHTLNKKESCHGKDGCLSQVPVEKALKTIVQSKLLIIHSRSRNIVRILFQLNSLVRGLPHSPDK